MTTNALIDPRGPERIIKHVVRNWQDGGKVTILLECGHSREPVRHFTYEVGQRYRCLPCLDELSTDSTVTQTTKRTHLQNSTISIVCGACEDAYSPTSIKDATEWIQAHREHKHDAGGRV